MKLLLGLVAVAGIGYAPAPNRASPARSIVAQTDSIYALAVKPEDYPDESYVWLLDEGVYRVEADGRTVRTTRQVVQILKPAAANVYRERQFAWNPEHDKLNVNWMRVVKLNGDVISDHPEQTQDSDIPAPMNTPTYTATKVRRMSLSGLDVGTILDFSVTTSSDAPMMPGEFMFPWRVTTAVPVMRSNMVVDVPAGMNPRITERNLNFKRRETVDKGRRVITWSASKVPKLQAEAFVPDTIYQAMTITVSPPFQWKAIGDWYAPIAAAAYAVTPPVEEKMKTVLAGSRSLDDSIAAIHKWVSQDIRYVAIELGRGGYVPRSAETVVRTGFGDCKDKAMLFLAALRKIGVTGYPVLLNASGARGDNASLSQFNHMIAAVKRGDGYVFSDLTASSNEMGRLPRSELGSIAVIVKEKEGEVVTLPKGTQSQNLDEAHIDGALSEDGIFTGTVENSRSGDLGIALRTVFSSPLDSIRQKAIGNIVASEYFTRPETDSLVAFDGKNFQAEAKVRVRVTKAKMLTRAGEVALLENPIRPLEWAPQLADAIDNKKERKLPYATKAMIALSTERIIARIILPIGWTATLPANVKLDGPVGYFELTYSQNGRELRIERTLRGADVVLPASRKQDIIDWLKKAGTEDGKMIVLKAPVHSVAN
jgi:transglutaminase-like putative cysteine protease